MRSKIFSNPVQARLRSEDFEKFEKLRQRERDAHNRRIGTNIIITKPGGGEI
jgi:hypothetical protein